MPAHSFSKTDKVMSSRASFSDIEENHYALPRVTRKRKTYLAGDAHCRRKGEVINDYSRSYGGDHYEGNTFNQVAQWPYPPIAGLSGPYPQPPPYPQQAGPTPQRPQHLPQYLWQQHQARPRWRPAQHQQGPSADYDSHPEEWAAHWPWSPQSFPAGYQQAEGTSQPQHTPAYQSQPMPEVARRRTMKPGVKLAGVQFSNE